MVAGQSELIARAGVSDGGQPIDLRAGSCGGADSDHRQGSRRWWLLAGQVVPTYSLVGRFHRNRLRGVEAGTTANAKNNIGLKCSGQLCPRRNQSDSRVRVHTLEMLP